MSYSMGLKVQKTNNIYQMCEELSLILFQDPPKYANQLNSP